MSKLFEQICDFESLVAAHKRAGAKGIGVRLEYLRYDMEREKHILDTMEALRSGTCVPKPSRLKYVTYPKPRIINVPDYSDRVLQQAIHAAIIPRLEARFIDQSFACRKQKGTHKAARLARDYIRRLACKGSVFFLKGDIKGYYAHIDHGILLRQLHKIFPEKDVFNLLHSIVTQSGFTDTGLPLGAVTSQDFANIYMDIFDHYVKDYLGIKYYIRYMDDFLVFSNSKEELRRLLKVVRSFLQNRLRLMLNSKTRIITGAEGCDFAGYRLFTQKTLPRKRNIFRMRQRLRRMARLYVNGRIEADKLIQVYASFYGYAMHADARNTIYSCFNEIQEIIRSKRT